MSKKNKTRKSTIAGKMVKSGAKPIKKLIAPPFKKPKSSDSKFFIAILLVLIVLFFASSFYNRYKMNSEAEKIIDSLVVGDELNEQALNKFMSTDYKELKKELGLTKDFTVRFEDKDENPIQINGMYGFGFEQLTN